jgi:phosphatidylglycerophosphatase A
MTENHRWAMVEFLHKLFCTGIFTGYLPIAPGTWGSLLSCGLLWFFWPERWYYQLPIILIFYPIAVYFAGAGEKYFGHDGHPIVIDEVIGQAIALFMAPHNLIVYLGGFLLFRLFDIIKPSPARNLEKLAGGTGVVADDIAAGVYAAIVLQLFILFFRKLGMG